MTYPERDSGIHRTLSYSYGNGPGDIDHLLSRITRISDSQLGDIAQLLYEGMSRQIQITYGNGVTKTMGQATTGCSCRDRFGRITDLHFTGPGGETIHRYQYTYDASGNRTAARVTQFPHDSTLHDNDRSYLYGYDGINRLVTAMRGMLSADNTEIVDAPEGPVPVELSWLLDSVGNWSGGDDATGSMIRTEGATTQTVHHDVNYMNSIQRVWTDGVASADYVSDPNGNLVFDGTHYYQYDAWNRLLQVSEIGTATLDGQGKITDGSPGPWVLGFYYDGLSRLIAVDRPDGSGGAVTTHLYYDGSRRVAEVVDDGAGAWTDREYIYGTQYVDEFLAQVDAAGDPMYVMQDANYNVIGLLDAAGQMLSQYVYDPYGSLAEADEFAPHADNRIGHQGLFFQALAGGGPSGAMQPGAVGIYYNRNRSYAPALGRFMQRDPNATGLPIFKAYLFNGQAASQCWKLLVNMNQLYGDGVNLFAYLSSNPLTHRDPSGLYLQAIPRGSANAGGAVIAGMLLVMMVAVQQQGVGLIIDGVTEVMAGSVSAGERLISAGESVLVLLADALRRFRIRKQPRRGKCEFYLAWCNWANNRAPADEGEGWKRDADCLGCYNICLFTHEWPFAKCPMGGPHGPRWPGPNDTWDPVWP